MSNRPAFICAFFILVFALSCKNEFSKCNASITQRKWLSDTTLRISYKYVVSGKIYEDSLDVKNKIIASDSFWVSFSNSNPKKHSITIQ